MQRDLSLLRFYLVGYLQVVLQAFGWSVFVMWGLQIWAIQFGLYPQWGPVLWHVFLTLCFVAFYPGQRVWTYRREGPNGLSYTIIGRENVSDAD